MTQKIDLVFITSYQYFEPISETLVWGLNDALSTCSHG